MSFDLIRRVWELELNAVEKLLLLALADFADAKGTCWPAVATLSRRTGLNERTVQRNTRLLLNRGLMEIDRRDGRASVYRLTLPRQSDTPGALPPRQTDTPDTVAPHPRQGDTPPPGALPPRTYQLNQTENLSPPLVPPEGGAQGAKPEHDEVEAKPKRGRFTPPTLDEITAYARAEKLGSQKTVAEFHDHYTANGWKVGAAPMKDWQAAYRNWVRREPSFSGQSRQPPPQPGPVCGTPKVLN